MMTYKVIWFDGDADLSRKRDLPNRSRQYQVRSSSSLAQLQRGGPSGFRRGRGRGPARVNGLSTEEVQSPGSEMSGVAVGCRSQVASTSRDRPNATSLPVWDSAGF